MAGKNLTVEILKEIRDEIRRTNRTLDETKNELSSRLDALTGRVDALERRQLGTETRLATELVAVAHAIGEVKELLKATVDLRPRVDDHERRISALEQQRSH